MDKRRFKYHSYECTYFITRHCNSKFSRGSCNRPPAAARGIIPPESQPDMFKQSKYFQLAGSFAEPIEKLIPQSARDKVHMQAGVEKEVAPGVELNSDLDDLFEKLTRPEIKKKKKAEEKEDKAVGYDKSEQKSLDRLIETIE